MKIFQHSEALHQSMRAQQHKSWTNENAGYLSCGGEPEDSAGQGVGQSGQVTHYGLAGPRTVVVAGPPGCVVHTVVAGLQELPGVVGDDHTGQTRPAGILSLKYYNI